VINSQTIDK